MDERLPTLHWLHDLDRIWDMYGKGGLRYFRNKCRLDHAMVLNGVLTGNFRYPQLLREFATHPPPSALSLCCDEEQTQILGCNFA